MNLLINKSDNTGNDVPVRSGLVKPKPREGSGFAYDGLETSGAFRQNEHAPDFVERFDVRLQVGITTGALADTLNDLPPLQMAQTIEASIVTSEHQPEKQVEMLQRVYNLVERQLKKMQNVVLSKRSTASRSKNNIEG